MARKDLELELLSLRFKRYSTDVRQCISRVVVSERCEDTSDKVIDELWKTCPDDMNALLARSGIRQSDLAHRGAAPTPETREIIRTFIDQARSYEAELGDLEDGDFETLYRTTFDPIVRAKRDRRARSARENDRWAFFNTPGADADFARWRDRLLTPAQAVALSFGKDPDVVTPESLEPYRRVGGSPFREAFKDRLDLIEAAAAAGELSVPMSVSTFTQWAAARGFAPPPELTGEKSVTIEGDAAFWKEKYEAAQSALDNLRRGIEELPPKSVGSLYRLILGMAIARFEHRTDQRSNSTTAILEELDFIGIPLKSDAIRGHLSDAAGQLDFEWRKPILWRKDRVSES